MKILLDECLPRKLKFAVIGHDVTTVPEMGWAGTKNGNLLRLAAGHFDVFLTADQNVSYQQNLETAQLAVIVLVAHDNRLETLIPLLSQVLQVLRTVQVGQVIRVGA